VTTFAILKGQCERFVLFLNKINNAIRLLQDGALQIPDFFGKGVRIPLNPVDRLPILFEKMVPAILPLGAIMFNCLLQIGLDFRKFKDRPTLHLARSRLIISECATGTLFPVFYNFEDVD